MDINMTLKQGELNMTSNIVEEYHKNGDIRVRYSVNVDNEIHGTYQEWHKNGQLTETYYDNGRIINELSFNNNGVKISDTTYNDLGDRELYREWYDNGQIAREMKFVNDTPSGEILCYTPEGEISIKSFCEHCELVSVQYFALVSDNWKKLKKVSITVFDDNIVDFGKDVESTLFLALVLDELKAKNQMFTVTHIKD